MDGSPVPDWTNQLLLEGELNATEKALRLQFVAYYLETFDPVQACIRCGFLHCYAVEFAKRFMNEAYTSNLIAEGMRAKKVDAEKEAEEDKALVRSVLRQASQNGPYASRVAAARALGAIYSMENPNTGGGEEQQLIDAMREFAAKAPV